MIERYARMPNIELRSIAGEHLLIVMHAGEAKMFSLNGMGVWFWEQLAEPLDQATLLERMLAEYDVTAADASAEISRFLAYLVGDKLARISDSSPFATHADSFFTIYRHQFFCYSCSNRDKSFGRFVMVGIYMRKLLFFNELQSVLQDLDAYFAGTESTFF